MAEYAHHERPPSGGRGHWALWAFLVATALFLIAEHSSHAFQLLPYLLLAACPLLHLLHGHGGHGNRGKRRAPDEANRNDNGGPAPPADKPGDGARP